MLASAVHQSDSVIYILFIFIYTHVIFHILFYDGLSQYIEDSSLCYIVGPCCSSQKPAF